MDDQNGQAPLICNRCNKPIYDGTIFKVRGQFFHNACLQCAVCRKQLNGSCFAKGADFYCNKDFTSLFGAKCCSCCGIITPTEGVRFVNGNVHHSACFTCVICGGAVKTGDYFYIRQDLKLLCKTDYDLHIAKATDAASDSDSDDGDPDIPHRTCINDRQLRMLRDTYQSDPKPSRQLIEKLSRKTGLRTRIVRIWFQNQKAKEKHLADLERGPQTTGAVNKGYSYPQTSSGGGFHNMLSPDRGHHHDNNNTSPYQLYCPLDYLLPDSMPPNIELSSADLRNGEVISPKVKDIGNCQFSGLSYQQQCSQNSFNKYMLQGGI